MIGDQRARFCGQCRLNVYNLSGMTRSEAEALIARAEGRLCVRFYRRSDGTILTENCPVGLRALKRRLSRVATATLSAIISFFAGLGLYTAMDEREPMQMMGAVTANRLREEQPVGRVMGTFAAEQPVVTQGQGEWAEGQMLMREMGEARVELPDGRDAVKPRAGQRRR
jgi:hypothetical protein